MKRGRLPLTALRSFEAAGRHESFTRASEELFVSQAAISRQVRDLEQQLGKALFTRSHRQVTLTPAGQLLLDTLSSSFGAIEACMSKLTEQQPASVLTVNAEPAVAVFWLVPLLKAFREHNRDIDVSVESSSQLIDFKEHPAEVAIRYSSRRSRWPGTETRHLYDSELIPVMSPTLLEEGAPLSRVDDLLHYTLLHEWDRDDWRQWFAISGVVSQETERGPIYDDGVLTLHAALDSQGVAVVEKQFAQTHIDAGRLIQPFDISMRQGAYWVVVRNFATLSDSAGAFVEWVGDVANASNQRSVR